MQLNFVKMNGAGNDFVMLDNRDGVFRLNKEEIAKICDRHRGVGADGVLMVEPARGEGDFRMRYYNSDGGEAEMCGNGARCFARYVNSLAGPFEKISFETEAGIIRAEFEGELVCLNMSDPVDMVLGTELEVAGETRIVHFVNTGVPHAVILDDSVQDLDVHTLGAGVRYHSHFSPKGTNVNFVQRTDDNSGVVRTYERGVEGETLACGTGVVASALIFHETYGVPAPIHLKVKGGEVLSVSFNKVGDHYENVTLTGPAEFVFEGKME